MGRVLFLRRKDRGHNNSLVSRCRGDAVAACRKADRPDDDLAAEAERKAVPRAVRLTKIKIIKKGGGKCLGLKH